MKTFVINLERSTERLANITASLSVEGIEFEPIAAIDGLTLSDTEQMQKIRSRSRHYFGKALSSGEVGCYLSQIACLERFLSSDANHCLILEDDAAPTPLASNYLKALIEDICAAKDLPPFYVINLCRAHKSCFTPVTSFSAADQTFNLAMSHKFPFQTTAMFWSRAGAKAFLQAGREIRQPVDIEIQCWIAKSGGGMAFDIPLFGSNDQNSEIDIMDPSARRRKPFRARWRRLQRQVMFEMRGRINRRRFRNHT